MYHEHDERITTGPLELVKRDERAGGCGLTQLRHSYDANDSTMLQAYPADGPELVGIDPTGARLRQYHPDRIRLIPDFFSAATFQRERGRAFHAEPCQIRQRHG
jgi:hypothetical protein